MEQYLYQKLRNFNSYVSTAESRGATRYRTKSCYIIIYDFKLNSILRDAKQHWELKDFMTIKETSIFNSVNLSMFMVNFSQIILFKSNLPIQSLLDLKSHFHGIKYANETLKLLPEKIRSKLKEPILKKLSSIGQIHSKLIIS